MAVPRVLVTGIGLVSPLGLNKADHLRRLLAGESGITAMTRPEFAHFPCKWQAAVPEFDRRQMISQRMLRKLLSQGSSYAVVAAGNAIRDAGLQDDETALQDCGLYIGSLSLDVKPDIFVPALRESLDDSGEFSFSRFATRGTKLIDPLFLVKLLPNGGICGISIEYQVNGPNSNITNGTVSGMQAVHYAAAAIQRGEAEMALAGGYDSLLHVDSIIEHLVAGRVSLRNGSPSEACRPFDAHREGYVLGEGAALLLLESEASARRRSARVYGEISGSSQLTDNEIFSGIQPQNGRSLGKCAQRALLAAGCELKQIDVVFGDGIATVVDDLMEAESYATLFETHRPAFSAATGSLGFIGAASGTFSLAHALVAMRDGVVPPLVNCQSPDERCKLPLVHSARAQNINHALVWNSDRGVKNVAVVLSRYVD